MIHVGLLEEAAEREIGPAIRCANCGRSTPRHTFCAHCGVALAALPKAASRRPVHALFAVGFGLAVVVALATILLVRPGTTKPFCAGKTHCGGPPGPAALLSVAPALLNGRIWMTPLGVRLRYAPAVWSVQTLSRNGVYSILLSSTGNWATTDLKLFFQVQRSSATSIADAIQGEKSYFEGIYPSLTTDTPGNQMLDPSIGSKFGVGEADAGTTADEQIRRGHARGGAGRRRGRAHGCVDGQPPGTPRLRLAVSDLRARQPDPRDSAMAFGERFMSWRSVTTAGRSVVVVFALVVGIAAGAWACVDLTGSAAAGTDRLLGPTPPDLQVALLVLRLREPAIARYLRGLVDPSSPLFEHYGDAASFGARFGLSNGDLAALRRALARSGLRVTKSYPQRTALRVEGTAAELSRVFDVTLRDYVTPQGVRYHAPATAARIRAPLARWLSGRRGSEHPSHRLSRRRPEHDSRRASRVRRSRAA